MPFVNKTSTASSRIGVGMVLLSGLLLSGCTMDGAELEDGYVAASHVERYPIRVAEAPVKMNISAKSGALRSDQVNSVIGFAQDARNNANSRIAVRYASGSANARIVAQQAVAILVDQGLPPSMIATGSYQGSTDTVALAFTRKVAVTTECGDWSENLGSIQGNETYPNQGCALQQNIAAMVANPQDFETPRTMTPVYGSARSVTLKKYNAGEWTSAKSSSSSSSGSGQNSGDVSTNN